MSERGNEFTLLCQLSGGRQCSESEINALLFLEKQKEGFDLSNQCHYSISVNATTVLEKNEKNVPEKDRSTGNIPC